MPKKTKNSKPPANDTPDKNSPIKKAILQNLKNGNNVKRTCELVGISRETFYQWLRKDQDFSAAVALAEQDQIKVAEDTLYQKALGGNPALLIFYLCNRAPERWKSVQRVDGRVADDQFKEVYDKLGALISKGTPAVKSSGNSKKEE
jgi:hypothetical protein